MRKPSILFINRVYPPDVAATGQLLADLSSRLVRDQFSVSVLTTRTTPAPTRECVDGVMVRRARTLVFSRAAHWKRALCYVSIYPAFLREGLFHPRPDIIVTMTDPPLQFALAPFLKSRHHCRWVHWAQDIYPDIAVELGVIPQRGVLTCGLRSIAGGALRRADRVIAVGRCMKSRLESFGVSADRIEVIPNWSLTIPGNSSLTPQLFRDKHQLNGKFVVMYSGNFGLAHAFSAIETAVLEFGGKFPAVQFVFIGDGPALPKLREKLKQCDNVLYLPFQSQADLPAVLASADIHIASMQENLCGLVVPSKLYGILAAGRPCIFIGPEESEAARVITDAHCGFVIPSIAGHHLVRILQELAALPDRVRELAGNAAAISRELTVEAASRNFELLFSELTEDRGTQAH